jgi:hypothetical protein
MTILRVVAGRVVTDEHLATIAHILMTDWKIPVVRFEIFYKQKLILVRAFDKPGGTEYFVKPKKDPFPALAKFLELDYTIRFRTRDDC